MRIGLDLRELAGDELVERAIEADRLGLWAVLISAADGGLIAAELATKTRHVHLALWIDATAEHAVTLAEEVAVLDHLSQRRVLAVVDGDIMVATHMRHLLAGRIVGGVVLAPPPAQTAVDVWASDDTVTVSLSGDLVLDRHTVDHHRDQGDTHIFVGWPGSTKMLARHLVSRALTPDFPEIVADHADVIAPFD